MPWPVIIIIAAPVGVPNGIRKTSVNITTVSISWNPINCSQQNSLIRNYTVYYRKRFGFETLRKSVNISAPVTSATIDYLDPHTEYVFEVQAVNENALRGPSTTLNVTTSIPEGIGYLRQTNCFVAIMFYLYLTCSCRVFAS